MTANGTKRTRDAERSRREILDAAEELFASRGFGGTSLQDVANAAGVSRGTPSYFFGSKEGLYRAVLARCFTQVAEVLRETRQAAADRGESGAELLRGEVEAYLDFLAAHPTFVRLVQWESVNATGILVEFSPRLELFVELRDAVTEQVENGRFRPLDPEQTLLSIMALCWFPLAEKDALLRSMGVDPYAPEFVAVRKRHVVDLILNGLLARPSPS